MKFCEKCGGYMKSTKSGYVCSKCGNKTEATIVDVVKIAPPENPTVVLEADPSKLDYTKVDETCPQCGNSEAFHSFGLVSGEHAGVRQERTMERFICIKCGYTWSKE